MSIEFPYLWGLNDDHDDRRKEKPSSKRIPFLNEVSGLSDSPGEKEALVESGRFAVVDVLDLPSSQSNNEDNLDDPSFLENPWDSASGDSAVLDESEIESDQAWLYDLGDDEDLLVDEETGEILSDTPDADREASGLTPVELAQLRCEEVLWDGTPWGQDEIENGEQEEQEALEIERLLDLGELDNELEEDE